MNIITEDSGLCVNLIIDGNIIFEHLKIIGMDSKWLLEQIRVAGIENESEILIAYIDHLKEIKIYLKNKHIPTTQIF